MQEFSNQLFKSIFLHPLYLTIFFVGVIFSVFYKQIVGWFGEYWAKKALNKLPKDTYKIINDLFIMVNGRTYQIDHVIVSKYGLFSIETKQYNMPVTGGRYDKKWVAYSKKKKFYYTNPIRQNYGHCKALSELLEMDESKIHNVVYVKNNSRLKLDEVVNYYTIANKILSYNEVLIENVDEIYNKLISSNITDKKARKDHVKRIKEEIEPIDDTKCPRCGSELVKRSSKNGDFIGCSNYPRCKYTRQK